MTVIAADGYVHFGDILQLGSCKTGAALALDTEDSDPRPGEYACALSASLDTTPMARNTFILVKYHLPKGAIPGGAYGPVYDDEVSLTVNRSTPLSGCTTTMVIESRSSQVSLLPWVVLLSAKR